jgi:hypothetical protein
VVAQHHARLAGVDHAAHGVQHLKLLWPAVDQVADKDGLPTGRRAPHAATRGVAEPPQQRVQHDALAVHVTDHVVHRLLLSCYSLLSEV